MADLTPRFLEIRVYNPINNHLLRVRLAKYDFLHTLRSCLTSLQAKSQLDSELRIVSPYRRRLPRSPITLFNNFVKLQHGLAIRLRLLRLTISSN